MLRSCFIRYRHIFMPVIVACVVLIGLIIYWWLAQNPISKGPTLITSTSEHKKTLGKPYSDVTTVVKTTNTLASNDRKNAFGLM
ncbi:hypothetical protein H9L19_06105 [Weissella diestrammenae]|uniref:Uncharacterized protein n=1 Tax=Weissella diestrammenae TaxID=1162633 RepID=A0A7G9T4D4_9LACO|nr:hypothetical protein [Weissella diestrammenae]MCM0583495.1 hypothetical protein [Weissella diestrammenae]QNN74959.1 hypothetical protein H9L19_06105 [Weissella diestrammenae]